jgi:hypothetical protein
MRGLQNDTPKQPAKKKKNKKKNRGKEQCKEQKKTLKALCLIFQRNLKRPCVCLGRVKVCWYKESGGGRAIV